MKSKKILLILLLLILYKIEHSLAQEITQTNFYKKGRVHIGIGAGINQSRLVLTKGEKFDFGSGTFDDYDSEFMTSFLTSINFEYCLHQNWGLLLKPGLDNRVMSFFERLPVVQKIRFIHLPILVNYHFGKFNLWNIHIGPHYSIPINKSIRSPLKGELRSSIGGTLGIKRIVLISDIPFFIECEGIMDVSNNDINWRRGNITSNPHYGFQRISVSIGLKIN